MSCTSCCCKSAPAGSYAGQLTVVLPWDSGDTRGRCAQMDACLVPEIVALWHEGVKTDASCCGHGDHAGWIGVHEDSREKMLALGYVPDPNAPHVFVSKTKSDAKSPIHKE